MRPLVPTLILLAIAVTTMPRLARGQASTQQPAAIIELPYVLIDGSRGIDTHVELGNVDDEPLPLRCFYEDTTPTCIDDPEGGTCLADPDACGDGRCVNRHEVHEFSLQLTPSQPLGWRASAGLSELPLTVDGNVGPRGAVNTGMVPAMPDPFQGTLRCVAFDDPRTQSTRNALVGTATIERVPGDDSEGSFDAAEYAAVGIPFQPRSSLPIVLDDIMVLGGAYAEYAACPEALILPHVFDGAIVMAGDTPRSVHTRLALATCGVDVEAPIAAESTLQFLVYNEYQQRFSTSKRLEGHRVMPMSNIDSLDPTRSIFFAGVAGTQTGQTEIRAVGAGAVGVAIEEHDTGDGPPHSAALELEMAGERREGRDLISFRRSVDAPICPGDCNSDGAVMIDELTNGVAICIGVGNIGSCPPIDVDQSGRASIDEMIRAVTAALNGCPQLHTPAPEPTPIPTLPIPPPTGIGPDIVHFGLASAEGVAQQPVGTDPSGRAIFAWPYGQGFTLVLEARRGTAGTVVGDSAYRPGGIPDLQLLVSRPLGDGSAAVCDADRPAAGGVPAVESLQFSDDESVVAAINDLGCRVDDGNGEARGRANRPCTRRAGSILFNTISPAAERQFCLPVARAWAFPAGDTIVAARLRSSAGMDGSPVEIVVRIGP